MGASMYFVFVLSLLPIVVVFIGEKPVPYLIIVLVAITGFQKNRIKNLMAAKNLLTPYLVIIGVYILYTLFAVDHYLAIKVLERQISLLLIPILVFSHNFSAIEFRFFFKTYILLMLVIFIISFSMLFWFMLNFADWIETMSQVDHSSTYLQFKFPHLIGVHPTYWSYLLILANTFLLSFKQLNLKFKNTTVLILLVIFNFNLLFLSARTPLVINIILHVIAILFYFKLKKFSLKKIMGCFLLSIIFAVIALNLPLVKAKWLISTNDERVYLWATAFEQIKANYFILGEGLGQGARVLKDYIIEKGDSRVHYRGFDLHNQYLAHYLDMGLLGFLSLIYLMTSPITIIDRKSLLNNLPSIGLSIMFLLGSLTEKSLYLLKGIIIFAVFSSILIKRKHQSTLKDSI